MKSEGGHIMNTGTMKKIIQYAGGLLLISVGINISKLAHLGISPVSSLPRAAELIWGLTLGTGTIIVHIICVLLQVVILRKRFKPVNILQILVGFVFGYMVDLTGTDPNAFGHLLVWFPVPQAYLLRLLYMIASVILIGLGVYIYLKPGWVPMATEGLAKAIAETTGKPFGNCKTLVDTTLVVMALILQLIFLGGLSSFTGENVVVREGTVIAAIFVGQVVKLCGKLFKGKSSDLPDNS